MPDDATVSAATFSLRGNFKSDGLNATPAMNVYSSAPASNTAIVAGDFDSLGSTDFCNSPITYAGFSTTGYNDFALNASVIAAINRTGVTKLGTRNANYDATGTPPTWTASQDTQLNTYFAEQGTGYKPKLVVTYTLVTEKTSSDTGSGTESLGSRLFGATETGPALEAALLIAAPISGDDGLGSELGGLRKDIFSGDDGSGFDAMKAFIETAGSGSDMRLYDRPGQVKMPSKGVNL